jgi:hypothetical protein
MHTLGDLLSSGKIDRHSMTDGHIFRAQAWNARFLWAIEALAEYQEPESEEVFLKGDETSEDSIWDR